MNNTDEQFFKIICKKYIDSTCREMLFEKDTKIFHITIEDDYIPLKEEGKITIDNFYKYIDGNSEIYKYKNYKEFFDSYIKDEIDADLNDLALFDEDNKWDFYLTFEEIKKLGYGYVIKQYYPYIEKYGVSDENLKDFFNHFSLEQLDDFEESLGFYFVEGSIVYEEIEGLTYKPISHFRAKENYSFNRDILRLACGLISYEDFIKDYIVEKPSKETLIEQEVIKYFYENKIENLKEYGCDTDEGLYKLSSLYTEIMDKLNIKYSNIFTEDGISGGKYITTIFFDDKNKIIIDTKSRDSVEYVRDNLISVSEEYKNFMQKENEKAKNEIDYELG